MTRDETLGILMKIDVLFPNWKPENLTMTTDAWAAVLREYPKDVVEAALNTYVTGNESGFAPSVSQLLGIIRTANENPMDEMTPNEAWELVYNAIGNSIYHADEEFAKLPELCKKAIGNNPASLRELAVMDIDEVQNVTGSHFKRQYAELVKRKREYDKIPVNVRNLIAQTTQQMIEG